MVCQPLFYYKIKFLWNPDNLNLSTPQTLHREQTYYRLALHRIVYTHIRHVTHAVGYFKEQYAWREVTMRTLFLTWRRMTFVERTLQRRINLIPIVITMPVTLWLTKPPWARSYTFGVHEPEAHTFETISRISEHMMLQTGEAFCFSSTNKSLRVHGVGRA